MRAPVTNLVFIVQLDLTVVVMNERHSWWDLIVMKILQLQCLHWDKLLLGSLIWSDVGLYMWKMGLGMLLDGEYICTPCCMSCNWWVAVLWRCGDAARLVNVRALRSWDQLYKLLIGILAGPESYALPASVRSCNSLTKQGKKKRVRAVSKKYQWQL